MKTRLEIATIAADWWCQQISNPKFDNGDKSVGGLFTATMASSLTKKVKDECLEKFKKLFIEYVCQNEGLVYFRVDYNPEYELAILAEQSGVDVSNFPWKTDMDLSDDFISVSLGYGAPLKYLYNTKKNVQTRIDSCKKHLAGYEDAIKKGSNNESDLNLRDCYLKEIARLENLYNETEE